MASTASSVIARPQTGEVFGERALAEAVHELRAAGRSPKEIARALGVRPAVVVPLFRAAARQAAPAWRR